MKDELNIRLIVYLVLNRFQLRALYYTFFSSLCVSTHKLGGEKKSIITALLISNIENV